MNPYRTSALLVSLLLAACSESGPGPTTNGTGGTSHTGGSATGGNTPATGGISGNSGGTAQSGGAPNSGGASSTGGITTGGIVATGGGGAGGAITQQGGQSVTGGASTTGGANMAGSTSTGGAGGSAGNPQAGATNKGGATNTGGNATGGGAGAGGKGGAGNTGGSAGNGGSASTGGSGGASSTYRPCPNTGPCKIMPFGDSITDGYGTAGGYRVELFRLAHQAGKNITFVGTGSNGPPMVDGVTFPPNHEGHSGFTIAPTSGRSGISPLVATVMPQFTPHIVTLMIGTNDAIDDYQMAMAPTRLGSLIDSIYAQLPNVLLVVAQPIPSQDDALNTRLQTYNAAIPAVVKARADAGKHILLVDMYSPFTANASYKTALLKDTWHPNEAGHVILGARWYATLASSL